MRLLNFSRYMRKEKGAESILKEKDHEALLKQPRDLFLTELLGWENSADGDAIHVPVKLHILIVLLLLLLPKHLEGVGMLKLKLVLKLWEKVILLNFLVRLFSLQILKLDLLVVLMTNDRLLTSYIFSWSENASVFVPDFHYYWQIWAIFLLLVVLSFKRFLISFFYLFNNR